MPDQTETRPLPQIDDVCFEHALDYMRKNFRTASLRDVAEQTRLSYFHFHRRFRQWAGRTPKEIMTELQIDLARKLLLEGELSLPKIARKCGFSHQSHLCARFRLCVGDSPKRWLRRQRAAAMREVQAKAA